MYLESLPKRLEEFKDFWEVHEVYVDVLQASNTNQNPVYYYNNEEFKNGGYYTLDSYKQNANLNFVLFRPPASWEIKSKEIKVIDFDSSGEIGSYLFSLFEYFSNCNSTFKEAKQKYKSNPNCIDMKQEYNDFKKELLEIRNVLRTHSKFSPYFQRIRKYCMYLINIGVTSKDFTKKDFRTIM